MCCMQSTGLQRFYLESYNFPESYFEMKKDQVGYDMTRFEWVVVKDKTVKIVIDQAETI